MRILPDTCAKTVWPLSSSTLNIAFGNVSGNSAFHFNDIFFRHQTHLPSYRRIQFRLRVHGNRFPFAARPVFTTCNTPFKGAFCRFSRQTFAMAFVRLMPTGLSNFSTIIIADANRILHLRHSGCSAASRGRFFF